MLGLVVSLTGAYGVYLLYTAFVFGRAGSSSAPGRSRPGLRARVEVWLVQAGLDEVRPAEFASVMAVLFVVGAAAAYGFFGGIVPPLLCGAFAASFPVAAYRRRRERRRREARDMWPRLIDEIRVLTGVGRSLPQAMLEVGRRAPSELRPAFAAAEREWLITTDFGRATGVLRARLADPTADAVCETLLVAHEIGGADIDRRLAALVDDRVQDLQGRKDAVAKQAGVRFARRFVLIVPIGMALAGLSIGTGREAYQTALGQMLVAVGICVVAGCWYWAGRLMRLPEEERVF